ncbi:hypothetical protein [Devosia sp. CN2-171]|uniref:hypothetical protein n=1 Tax=Devosia sp. CN2-171 TaxID=3400909 RepID=UPI003BF8F4AA
MYVLKPIPHSGRDLPRIREFATQHGGEGVRVRPGDLMEVAAENGLALELSDAQGTAAIALLYDFSRDDAVFGEIGTMVVGPDHQGQGLQHFLASVQLIQIAAQDYPFDGGNIFAVVTPGTASEHVLVNKVGFVDWSPGELVTELRSLAGIPFNPEKRNLSAPNGAIKRAAEFLLSLRASAQVYRVPTGDSKVRIEFSWPFDEVVDELADVEK